MAARALLFTILFFCSGATALIYEVVWSKYLSQMFGSTVYAQTVVLAVFMGGLALGNSLFGRNADRLRNPMRAYGYIEIAIGIYAFFFSSLFAAADVVFVKAGAAVLDHSWLLLTLKCILSIALLLGPTLLMGGTLPLVAAWLNTNVAEAGRRSALFYAVNSLGAVLGAGLAGFYLIRHLGMVSTLQLTAMGNTIIGGLAIVMSSPQSLAPAQLPLSMPESGEPIQGRSGFRRAAWLVALTGAISMGLEVLASRSLALIFGSSLQAFAVVLMAFIFGIGLGSAWICRQRRRWKPDRLAIILLLAAATWIGVLILNIENWVEFYRWAIIGLGRTEIGYTFHHLLTAFMSIFLLGIPAALLGSVLPLQIRSQQGALGRDVGRLLTANTLGAVAGVIITGFALMPMVGLRNAFLLLALVLCGAGALAARKTQFPIESRYSGLLAGSLAILLLFGGEGWRHVMSSGVFRAREKHLDPTIMAKCKKHLRILFYEDAPDATVTVQEGDGIGAPNTRGLSINGKADASNRGDLSTQLLVGHLPLLAKPESKDVFILGVGSGITGGAVIAHPIQRVTIAENCAPVVRAAQLFNDWNRGVLTNPVARVWLEDARTILKLSPQQYDVIISQPSNPWTVGVGSVFSQEYYQLASSRLKPGGLMVQWFHIYDIDDATVLLVLRTFGQTFSFVEIWDTGSGDLVLLGAHQPWASGPDVFRAAFERKWVREDMEIIGIRSPEALLARQLASQRTAFAIAGDGPIQRDHFPILEYEAPKAFFIGRSADVLCKYDERTTQADAAPAEKRSILQALEDDKLKSVFSQFKTINPHLVDHLRWRFHQHGYDHIPAPASKVTGLFLEPESNLKPDPIAPDTEPEIRELLTACNLLKSSAKTDGIDRIARLLQNRGPKSDWSAGHYAALAARTSLALGDTTRSRNLVRLGLKVETHDELLYLDRILDREASLNPRKLSAVK